MKSINYFSTVLLFICVFLCNGCEMFTLTPRVVRHAEWRISSLRCRMLAQNDVAEIYSDLVSLARHMILVTPKDPSQVENELREYLDTLKAVYAKAKKGWPKLKLDPGFARNMRFKGQTPEHAVIHLVNSATYRPYRDFPDSPILNDYKKFDERVESENPWLKRDE